LRHANLSRNTETSFNSLHNLRDINAPFQFGGVLNRVILHLLEAEADERTSVIGHAEEPDDDSQEKQRQKDRGDPKSLVTPAMQMGAWEWGEATKRECMSSENTHTK
jgi:hypothetical protein